MFQVPRSMINESGVTLIEIIVVVAIITIFSAILISDFPSIERQFYLTRAAYQLAQDLRRVQSLSLSGSFLPGGQSISGYGLYINTDTNPQSYILYADSCKDQKYTIDDPTCPAGDYTQGTLGTIDMTQGGRYPEVYIEGLTGIDGGAITSIDFTPPNPTTTIQNISAGYNQIGIILGLKSDPAKTKEVDVNTAGFINVK